MKAISVAGELLEGRNTAFVGLERRAAAVTSEGRPEPMIRSAGDRLGGGMRRPALLVATALATYETVVDGIEVSVMIERPEVDRAGIAWRCRIRVDRATGRREQSQVVGTSAEAVLRQAIELAATRLGIGAADLLGEASVGIAAEPSARTARPIRRAGWSE